MGPKHELSFRDTMNVRFADEIAWLWLSHPQDEGKRAPKEDGPSISYLARLGDDPNKPSVENGKPLAPGNFETRSELLVTQSEILRWLETV
jgi:hypothetical protein